VLAASSVRDEQEVAVKSDLVVVGLESYDHRFLA
jgi:hypothetical protein